MVWLSHLYMTTGKTTALPIWNFTGKVMALLFNTLSRFVIAFLPRRKPLSMSSLQSPSAVILKPKKIKSMTVSIVSPSICHEVMGLDTMIFVFWMLSFKPVFSLSSFTLVRRLSSSFSLSAITVVSSAYQRLLIFFPAGIKIAGSGRNLNMTCSYILTPQIKSQFPPKHWLNKNILNWMSFQN